jgi:hypothetical protein
VTSYSSSIVDVVTRSELETKLCPAYFFFDSRDSQESRQTFGGAICNILWQLCQHLGLDSFPEEVLSLHRSRRGEQPPSRPQVLRMLSIVLAALPDATIILDALDECIDKEELLNWLRRMVEYSQRQSRVRIFTTSRDDDEISECLGSWKIRIEEKTRGEIECYIKTYIERHPTTKNWGDDMKERVCKELLRKGEGM